MTEPEPAAEPALPARSTPPAPPAPTSGRGAFTIKIIGGLRRRGTWRVPVRETLVTLVGGIDADLTDATFDAPDVVLTKISLVGGVSLTVPAGVAVLPSGFQLLGGSPAASGPPPGEATATVHLRSFTLVGGVSIKRS